jgi:APA family basic amino acid/polyamine antiporter
VLVLVLTVDIRGAIGFSSFGVLLYYFVANVSALTQKRDRRMFPRTLFVLGGAGCLLLVATLPLEAIVGGLVVLVAGVAYRGLLAP